MFPAVFFANIHKYQLFPVPSDFVIVPPDVNVVLNVFSDGAVVLCVHWYFKLLAFTVLVPEFVTVTVVLCDFLYVVFPFVPNVTIGCVLSIFVTVRLATLVESDPWFVLSILLAYIVLFVSIVSGAV